MDDIKQSSYTGTAASKSGMVTGMFKDRDSAERAYGAMTDHGYTSSDINLVMSDETRKTHFTSTAGKETELGSKAAEGAGIGGVIGGTVGAIAAAVAAIGTSLLVPGLGLVIAGPLAAAVAGAGAGSVTGGLIGALVGWGIPEERVKAYEEDLRNGGILMGFKPKSDEDATEIQRRWRDVSGAQVQR
ncbi:MAG: hypothetical protein V4709_14080 [Pseudomonadota bacterium]